MEHLERRRLQPILLGVLLLLLVTGLASWAWWASMRPAERAVTLYYTDAQAMFLIPVSQERALPGQDTEALAELLESLSKPPEGLTSPLPAGTEATVQTISNGLASVTLQLPSSMGSGGERILAGAVVRTAASLGSVREVKLQLRDRQGTPYESQHLDLSAPLSPTAPETENLYLEGGQAGLTVTLYYATPDGRYLVPLRRPLPPQYGSQPLEGSFQLLVAGPPPELATFLSPSVPAHPGIGWGGIDQGTARILWPPDQPPPSPLAMRAFALTLTETEGIQAVAVTRQDQELARSGRPEVINPAREAVYPSTPPGKTD